jgi:hypothetical protein
VRKVLSNHHDIEHRDWWGDDGPAVAKETKDMSSDTGTNHLPYWYRRLAH